MLVKIKHPVLQMLCKHNYQNFKTPDDERKKKNPYGFVSLNSGWEDKGIWVCVKCGKRRYK
jgi:hypothetical protein